MSVVVLVPVLNRPHRALPLAKNLRETCDAELLFIVSQSDSKELEAVKSASGQVEGVSFLGVPWKPAAGDYAKKINFGFNQTDQTWVFTGADDLFFHPNWLENALAVHHSTNQQVIGTNDLCNPTTKHGKHSTHTLVHREYIEDIGASWDGPGVVLHEGYDHQYIDNELVVAAKMRREWAHASDSHVQHLHPLCGGSVRDATYNKALARGREDGRLFLRRMNRAQQGLPV